MSTTTTKFTRIIDSRWIEIILFIILVCVKTILYYKTFYPGGVDAGWQVESLHNLYLHNGCTVSDYKGAGGIVYKPLNWFAPGMQIFLLPIYLVTQNVLLSLIFLNAISICFFALFIKYILQLLQVKPVQKIWFYLFFIITPSPLIFNGSTDIIGIAICGWGFYFILKDVISPNWKYSIIGSLLIGLAYFVRFSIIPFFALPVVLYLSNCLMGKKVRLSHLVKLIVLNFFVFLLFRGLAQAIIGPSFNFFSPFDKFYFYQLKSFDYFLLHFGISDSKFQQLLVHLPRIGWRFWKMNHVIMIYQITNALIIVSIVIYSFFIKAKRKASSVEICFSEIVVCSLGLIITFLTLLSVLIPGQTWKKPYWTFVEDTRYYAVPIIFSYILIIYILIKHERNTFGRFTGFLKVAAFVLVLLPNLNWDCQIIGADSSYPGFASVYNKIRTDLKKFDDHKPLIVYYDKKDFRHAGFYGVQFAGGATLCELNDTTVAYGKYEKRYTLLRLTNKMPSDSARQGLLTTSNYHIEPF